jgi:hypothetical protein
MGVRGAECKDGDQCRDGGAAPPTSRRDRISPGCGAPATAIVGIAAIMLTSW